MNDAQLAEVVTPPPAEVAVVQPSVKPEELTTVAPASGEADRALPSTASALPLMALFMKLLYWRPRRYYLEHLLLLLHNHR